MRGIAGIVAVSLLVAACQQAPAELKADKAWARLPAVPGRPGVAYFTLHGGGAADTLLAVTTPAALRAEVHETVKTDAGAMSMRPLPQLAVPAGADVAFAPGGKHVMLFDVGPNVKPGDRIPLVLAFAGGKRLEVQAEVVGPGDPAPAN